MKRQKGHLIKAVQEGSIAQEMEIEAGDRLLSVNGEAVEDVFDYQYLMQDEYVEVSVLKPPGRNGCWRSRRSTGKTWAWNSKTG